MGDAADDLAHQEWQESSRWHHELNPRGYKMAEDFVWTTRDGKRLKVSDMETSHIQNCLKMLERTLADRPDEQFYMGGSDYAEDAVESENRHNEALAEKYQEAVRVFKTELSQRLNQTVSDNGRARTLQNKTNDGGTE